MTQYFGDTAIKAETVTEITSGNGVTLIDGNTLVAKSNKIGLGTSTPGTTGSFGSTRLDIQDVDGGNSDILQRVGTNGDPTYNAVSHGGTLASPTASASNGVLLHIAGLGYTGTTYGGAASIYLLIDGSVSSTSMPGRIIFSTTPTGSIADTERMRIDQAGNVGINKSSPTSKLHVEGSTAHTVVTKTANYTLAEDHVILADASGGAITMTLPTAVGIQGRIYTIKRINSGANAVNIATTSSQTIDGSTTAAINVQYVAIKVISDNANWHII